jgi:poly(3-hydroxyalkanoate) synthetase
MNEYKNSKMWHTPHRVVYETDAVRLLQFSHTQGTPLIIVPPQAGHHSNIADYAKGQSLVECAVLSCHGSVYAIEWKSCTYDRRDEGILDLIDQLSQCVTTVGGRASLVGLCQGGWLAVIYAMLNTERVSSLVIAGAPIDTKAGNSSIHAATKVPLIVYQTIVLLSGGLMLGETMLAAWKSSNISKHYFTRYLTPDDDSKRFYKWYDHTQHIAGRWYLWAVEYLFKKNKLGTNELKIANQPTDLRELQKLNSVHIVTGLRDDITPPEQSLALQRYTVAQTHSVDAGHIGVFMSNNGITNVWHHLFAGLDATI